MLKICKNLGITGFFVYCEEKKTLTQIKIILEIPHYGVATSIASKRDVRRDYYPIVFLNCP
jgi:hypothetical protein